MLLFFFKNDFSKHSYILFETLFGHTCWAPGPGPQLHGKRTPGGAGGPGGPAAGGWWVGLEGGALGAQQV